MHTSTADAQIAARASAITVRTLDLPGMTGHQAADPTERVIATIRSVNLYARKSAAAAYPLFEELRAEVTGLLLIENQITGYMDPELTESDFPTDDIRAYHARVCEWGNRNDRIAFPTFIDYPEKLEACLLEPSDNSTFLEIDEKALSYVEPEFKIGTINSYPVWARAVNNWALSHGYIGGIATFARKCLAEEACVYGAFLFADESRDHYTTGVGLHDKAQHASLKLTNTHITRSIVVGIKRQQERSFTRYKIGPGKSVDVNFSNDEILYFTSNW